MSPLLLQPPELPRAEGLLAAPGGHGGIGARSHTGGLGTSSWCVEDPDLAEGVPAAGLANLHVAIVEGRQCGQDLRPQP
jgi:hypothetical protein